MFNVQQVANPQMLEVVLSPPSPANRLFIFTGTSNFTFPDTAAGNDNLLHDTAVLDVSFFHGNKLFNRVVTQVVASASLASIRGTDDANDVTWAADRVTPVITAERRLLLNADVALQDKGGFVFRFGYEVFVQTTVVA